jgi:hypothetical protein
LFIIIAIFSVSLVFCGAILTVHAQSDLQTTKHRDMVIDLGNGLITSKVEVIFAKSDGLRYELQVTICPIFTLFVIAVNDDSKVRHSKMFLFTSFL